MSKASYIADALLISGQAKLGQIFISDKINSEITTDNTLIHLSGWYYLSIIEDSPAMDSHNISPIFSILYQGKNKANGQNKKQN